MPVLVMVDRESLGVIEYDVGRQVPVLCSQAVAYPGAEGGQPGQHPAAGDLPESRLVGQVGGLHRADQGDVSGMAAEVGLELGEVHPRGTVL